MEKFIFCAVMLENNREINIVFQAINHWFGVAVIETGDEFSMIYVFITIFVNNIYSNIFAFHCKKISVFQICKNEPRYLKFMILKIYF